MISSTSGGSGKGNWAIALTVARPWSFKGENALITSSEIERISPLSYQHIHAYGHYAFNRASRPSSYRPLRPAQEAPEPAAETLNRV